MIFTTEQLAEKVQTMNRDQLLKVTVRLLSLPVSTTMRNTFAKIVMGDEIEAGKEKEQIFLSKDRAVPVSKIRNLAGSEIIHYVPEIIHSALDPRGPFDSRGILMLASEMKGGKAPFITPDGIPQGAKNEAGIILSMAGFERVSHYDRETRRPIKAWKVKHGWGGYSVQERIEIVFNTIKEHVYTSPVTQTPPPLPSLKDFL